MNVLSLIGILLGIALFVVCAFRGVNMFLAAFVSSIVIMLLSGMPLMHTINTVWMNSVVEFLRGIMLIFIFSSLFGKTLSDGKASKSIANAFARLIRKRGGKNQKLLALLFVPIMYGTLTYVGISVYVVVFTVLGMARDLFQEMDVPWRFYVYGGGSSVGVILLGGNLTITNIMLDNMFHNGLTAGMALSVVGCVVFYAVVVLLAKIDLKRAEKNGEGFLKTGEAFKSGSAGNPDVAEEMPPVPLALLPMLAVIVIAVAFNQVILALIAGILLNLVLFRKYIPDMNATVSEGVTSGFAPVINVAAAVAITSMVALAPGFSIISDAFERLPVIYGGVGLVALLSFLTSSPTGALPAIAPTVYENMLSVGVPPAAASRLIAASVFTSVGPHSPGVVNTTALARIQYRYAVKIYLKASLIPGTAAMLAMLLCYSLGLSF